MAASGGCDSPRKLCFVGVNGWGAFFPVRRWEAELPRQGRDQARAWSRGESFYSGITERTSRLEKPFVGWLLAFANPQNARSKATEA